MRGRRDPEDGARTERGYNLFAVKFRLRSYTPQDFEIIHEVDQRCFEKEIAYSRAEMRAYLKLPGAECVIAESGPGKIAGFCLAAHEKGVGYLVTMDVLEKYRRQGLGGGLLEEMEKRLAARGAQEMWLETATDNEPAIAFWNKHGYRKQGTRKNYYPNGRDAYTMRKKIADSG